MIAKKVFYKVTTITLAICLSNLISESKSHAWGNPEYCKKTLMGYKVCIKKGDLKCGTDPNFGHTECLASGTSEDATGMRRHWQSIQETDDGRSYLKCADKNKEFVALNKITCQAAKYFNLTFSNNAFD